MKKETKNPCPDCGNAQTNHSVTKISAVLTILTNPIIAFLDRILLKIQPIFKSSLNNWFLPKFFKFLTNIGLGKIAYEPDVGSTGRARAFWNECLKRGIKVWEFRLFGTGRELFVAEYLDQTLAFDGLPRPGIRKNSAIFWMDDKDKMRKAFKKADIPIASGGKYFSWRSLKKDFEKLTKPVIVKPHQGSRSRHTTTHVETLADLKIAFKKAKQLSPFVIMEEELLGFVYRGTIIGEKVVAILRREPPCVRGNAIHTVSELVAKENKNPLRDEKIFHKIVLGDEAKVELARQNITLNDIPEKGRVITFHQKSSRGIGGGATDVTDIIHPDNVEVLNKIAETVGDSLIGVDFIIDDITRPFHEQKRSGVIECNSMPFIDLHLFPLSGKPRDTAGFLCDLVFPESKALK